MITNLLKHKAWKEYQLRKLKKICLKSEQKDCGHYTHTEKML